jgi:ABC-type transporter Mla subunit MlaD
MASIKDVEKLADDLEGLVDQLRNELKNGPDFEKLVQIADQLSEHADNAAETFNTVNDALMSRLGELTGGGRSSGSSRSGSSSGGSQQRQKAEASA